MVSSSTTSISPSNFSLILILTDELIVNSYRATRREAGDLETLVATLKTSEAQVKNTAYNKLDVIAEQIKFLQNQAKEILHNAAKDSHLHSIPCNFVKSPGQIYHLYERPSGEKFWSMVSPEEFGAFNKNESLGSWRLEADRSFTKVEQIDEFAEKRKFAEALMNNVQKVPALTLFDSDFTSEIEPDKK